MEIREFQRLIEEVYFDKDSERGLEGSFRWFVEEVGELARAMREGDRQQMGEEFADVFAWLSTMASMCEVELEEAVGKYSGGCPKCGQAPCRCE